MSAAASRDSGPDPIVERLRAAGCVFAEDEAQLLRAAADSSAGLDALVGRRVRGEPLEALLGWAEFCGLRIAVEPGVFVPRQRTAFLVAQAAALARPGAVVVDLCCGTGAVGAAVAAAAGVEVYAADIEPAAVRCARRNLPPDRVYEGDLYAALPSCLRGRVDLLVVNAPYVPTDAIATMPPEARDHEPRVALDGGADGLDVQRRVAADATAWLRPGGALLIESGEDQAPYTAAAFAAAGLVPRATHSEELYATVVIGVRPL
jgi:release factor glutamine methyltransferase